MRPMWKWIRRLILVVFVIIALPCIAFTGFLVWAFQPTLAFGRGIGDLSRDDQIAYLILVHQM